MPYYGLLDEHGNEVSGGGYHRIDACNTHFKISPASVRKSDHLTFVSVDPIQWPEPKFGASWQAVMLAMFDEVDSKFPMSSVPLDHPRDVRSGEILIISSGSMRIGWKWKRDDDDDEPIPPSPVTELLARERKSNETLRQENNLLRAKVAGLETANRLLLDELKKIKHA